MPVVIFSKHAKIRIKERGVALVLVKKTLREPDHVTRGTETNVYTKRVSDQNLIVITAEESQKIIVITAYYENHLR